MIAGLSFFTSERSNKNSRTKRCSNRAISPNGLWIGKKRVADPVDVCRRAPRMNAFRAANLMRRRAIPAVGADEYWRIDFAPEILQKRGKQNDCAGHVMRELAQEQSRLATVDEHQFCERKVPREPNFMRFLPAANFIEETRQTMNSAVITSFGFARSQ